MKYHVIFNPRSGAALGLGLTGEALTRMFADAGHAAHVDDGEE